MFPHLSVIQRLIFSLVLILSFYSLGACQPKTPIEGHTPTKDSSLQPKGFIEKNPPNIAKRSPSKPPPAVRFENLSVEDGLAHSEVLAVVQDPLGFLWFGTQNGLSKYDGHHFSTYRHDLDDEGSLRDNFIESLFVDSLGNLWVGTQEGWLERFNRKDDNFTHYHVSAHVFSIAEGTEGDLWLGTKEPGLLRIDPETSKTETIWPALDVMSVIVDDQEQIWAASPEDGLVRYDPITGELTIYPQEFSNHKLAMDANGNLWIATWGGGLGRWDEAFGVVRYDHSDPNDTNTPPNDYLSTLHVSADGDLWIGTYQEGISRYQPNTGVYIHYKHDPTDPYSLSQHAVLSIYEDRSGVLWIGGATGGGIHRLSVDADRFGHYRSIVGDPNSLSSALVTSIGGDGKGTVWIGTFTGLDRWNQITGKWRNYHYDSGDANSLINDTVRSIYVDSNGTVWVGTEGGLERYDPSIYGFEHLGGPVVMWMHEGASGHFWMATKDGFFEFDRDHEEFRLINEGFAWKIMVLEDDQGRVWLGSSGDGLDLYDTQSGNLIHFAPDPTDPKSISDNFIETIHQDRDGRLWFGTGSGLNRFNEQEMNFVSYHVDDGLPDDRIAGILEDAGGNLWLSTNSGLSRFDPDKETFENFTVRDGLQSNIFWRNSYFQSSDGELFFGGDNGINAFYPKNILTNSQAPPVVITEISLFNQARHSDLAEGEHLVFEYSENFLSFDFVALDYTDPQQNQYAYQMVGLDTDWVQAGNRRHADYPNLRPGEYIFRVIGSNNDGVWNEVGASVAITIRPPFWQTPWFISLVIAALIGAGYGAYRYRVRSLQERSRQLEKEIAERTTELQSANLQLEQEIVERERAERALAEKAAETAISEERNRLARDLHDAVTQTLFSASLIAEVLPRLWQRNPVEGERRLNELRELSRGALAEMRTLLLELRPTGIVEVPIADLLQHLAESTTGRARLPVRLEIEGEGELPPNVKVTFYRVAQEALNNVSKHANADQVVVTLNISDPIVQLRVVDDGLGFEVDQVTADHLGLGIMRERAQSISADLEVQSEPGEGTQVVLTWYGDEGTSKTGDGGVL